MVRQLPQVWPAAQWLDNWSMGKFRPGRFGIGIGGRRDGQGIHRPRTHGVIGGPADDRHGNFGAGPAFALGWCDSTGVL